MQRILYLWVPHLQTTLERRADPALCDRPLLVVATTNDRRPTIKGRRSTARSSSSRRSSVVGRRSSVRVSRILDASPEAEACGVTAGMAASVAARRCPEAVGLVRERAEYEPVAVAIGDCLAEHTPWVERLEGAQDEFFADLGEGGVGEGEAIARQVATRIAAELGLEAQIALATSRFVARCALRADGQFLDRMNKIDRINEPDFSIPSYPVYPVDPVKEREFLRPLPIEALWEARPEVRRRMQRLGLRTLGQLAAVPQRWLVELFGPVGRWYGLLARGIDPRGVRAWNPAPSITAACDLPAPTDDRALLEACLHRLATRIARRLVCEGLYGRTVALTLTFEDGRRLSASRALKEPTNLARTLARTGAALLEGQLTVNSWQLTEKAVACVGPWGNSEPPSLLSTVNCQLSTAVVLSVSNLESHGALQLSIFGDVDRGPALRAAIARIQERFGEDAIEPAGMLIGNG
jgi:DNA polymerase-4